MTIIKRNRLIRRIANVIAERDGREELLHHDAEQATHSSLCCEHAYEAAAHDTFGHLTSRRVYRSPTTGRVHLAVGLPAMQRMLGDRP